jgi:hypothetical protein
MLGAEQDAETSCCFTHLSIIRVLVIILILLVVVLDGDNYLSMLSRKVSESHRDGPCSGFCADISSWVYYLSDYQAISIHNYTQAEYSCEL